MKHVFLIDGSGFVFRAYFGIKEQMRRSDGTLVNAVYGFTSMIMKLLHNTDADHVAVIFDAARKTFRNDIYAEYKAHRPPPPDDLIPQFDLVRQATRALNIACIEAPGFEADDLIATYARQAAKADAKVTIVSSDKDLMQLVGGSISMFDAMKNRKIDTEQVVEKFGAGPDKVIDIQALAGDAADNVPGVPGIGVKTAAQLIGEYGDLENLLANAGEIKQPKRRMNLIEFADDARMSKKLVTLKDDVPLATPLEEFTIKPPVRETLLAFLSEQGFKSLITRVENNYDFTPRDKRSSAAEAPPTEKKTYELVQSISHLKRWIDEASAKGVVAVDTETTSLDAMTAELVGVSLSVKPGRACYIPLGHRSRPAQGTFDLGDGSVDAGNGTPEQISMNEALAILKPMLEDPATLKIGHNIKYDMLVLAKYDVAIKPIDDTMVISCVLDCGLHGHSMDELAELHLEHQTIKYKDITGCGKNKIGFEQVSLDKALDYAAEDADITLALYQTLKPRLLTERLTSVYETIERPLVKVLVEMEKNGILVDAAELKRLSNDFAIRLVDLENTIHELAGHEFNVASPKQLGEVLFDEMGLQGGKKGKTGARSTSHDVLEGLATKGHKLPERVLAWRQLAKLKSTYTDALFKRINKKTGRVHTSFSMAGTSTGRLASSDPNLQNIPIRTAEGRKIRRAFIPPKGTLLLCADYSQIELRLLAHVAEIDVLQQAFRDGLDIHAITASQVFGVPVEGMDAMVRRQAKAVNFGIIYGISAFGLARQLDISNTRAADYIKKYFARYPGIKDYMERTKKEARDKGFVTTLFGRKCHIRSINDKNPQQRAFAERAAINAPIQGGAADIIKRAMIRLPDALKEAELGARMLLQVHDELIFEVPETEVEKTTSLVKNIMENAASIDMPLIVDIGTGHNWDEAH